ncbi:MAG TPA: hypothetical protein VGI28_14020, partial [Stellaceae bacterium]
DADPLPERRAAQALNRPAMRVLARQRATVHESRLRKAGQNPPVLLPRTAPPRGCAAICQLRA